MNMGAEAHSFMASERPRQEVASRAVTLRATFPLRALETGQFSFASSAAERNASSSTPGTSPATSMSDVVIPVPGSERDRRGNLRLVGACPAFARAFEMDIEKQDA